MKNLIKSILVVSIFTFVATSCSDDDNDPTFAKPVISNLEVGTYHHGEDEEGEEHNHDHEEESIGHIGEDLHINADIEAEGKIAYIMVEIHNEQTNEEVVEQKFIDDEFVGLKNTNFHKHVDIPATTTEGEYHFHIKVVDQEGQETVKEMEIQLVKE